MTAKEKRHAIRQANKALSLKLKLESPFKRELKSYFYRQYKLVLAGELTESIEPILDKHYKRVVKATTGIKLKQEEEDNYNLEEIIGLLLLNRAVIQAGFINSTTQKKHTEALKLARQTLAESGITNPTEQTLIKTAANIFRSWNKGRVTNIATTETQQLTEDIFKSKTDLAEQMMQDAISSRDQDLANAAAQMAESQTYQEIADDIFNPSAALLYAGVRALQKTWITMGDNKVRPWHNEANFQTVLRSEPFVVMGERLMYPGDRSLGATSANICSCRCHSSNL